MFVPTRLTRHCSWQIIQVWLVYKWNPVFFIFFFFILPVKTDLYLGVGGDKSDLFSVCDSLVDFMVVCHCDMYYIVLCAQH